MGWFGAGSRGSAIPTPQSLLRSVYVGRVCVAAAIYLAAALKFAVAAPLDLLVTSFVLVATVVVTSASYWYTHFLRRSPGRTFRYGQALFDVGLITTVVHITGGPQSDLTPLYVPLIAVTAVLMPPGSTALIRALVGIVYFADVFFGHRTPMPGQVALQLLVFVGVAAVTAYFASRVSVMGAEREALAGELRQARLEAADVLRNIPTGIVTVDQSGHLLYCNPAAEQILGFKERLWRGRPIMPEFAKVAPELWAAITATARRGVRAMRVEATVRRADRTFPIGVTTTTLEVEPATQPRVTAIFTGISDSERLAGGATPLEGDEDLLHRVVSNLVLNAVQAGGKEARVVVHTGRPALQDVPRGAGLEHPVMLTVTDNGPGIPEHLRPRLFEPFVTGRVGGTGLGLAIVQRAVEAHRGLVLVDSVAGRGTTFTVYLPAARRKEEAA